MSKFYAQIDENNIVFAVTQTHGAIDASNMIELESYEVEKLDNSYDPATGIFTPVPAQKIRTITTQAFFRRLTPQERTQLRGNSNSVRDFKEDLDRGSFVDLDGILGQQILDTGIFDQSRVEELLDDGTPEETLI